MMTSLLGLTPASRIAVAAIFMVAFFSVGATGTPMMPGAAAVTRSRGLSPRQDDLGAVAQAVDAVSDDGVAQRNAGYDRLALALGDTQLDRLDRHGAVGIDGIDEGAGRAALDCRR